MSRKKLRNIIDCSLCAALLAVCAYISIPVGDMSFTMQTFALFLTLILLGGKWGSISCLVYLLLGAAGLPVFSGFRGGIGALLGVTGGYLWGLLAAATIYWVTVSHKNDDFHRLLGLFLGLLGCYACGSVWYAAAYAAADSLPLILAKCVVPYIIPDAVKLVCALALARRLKPLLK